MITATSADLMEGRGVDFTEVQVSVKHLEGQRVFQIQLVE